jgi:hypothetical protein
MTSLPLKMGPIGCPETSVWNYHSTLDNIPEDRIAHIVTVSRVAVLHKYVTTGEDCSFVVHKHAERSE